MRGMKSVPPGVGQGDILAIRVVSCILINMDYQHEQHTVHLIVYHIIWCPKRRHLLTGKLAERVTSSLYARLHKRTHGKSCAWLSSPITSICLSGPIPLTCLPILHGSSRVARLMCGGEEFAHLKRMPSLWTRSTFYSTAGNVSAEATRQYIERQGRT